MQKMENWDEINQTRQWKLYKDKIICVEYKEWYLKENNFECSICLENVTIKRKVVNLEKVLDKNWKWYIWMSMCESCYKYIQNQKMEKKKKNNYIEPVLFGAGPSIDEHSIFF